MKPCRGVDVVPSDLIPDDRGSGAAARKIGKRSLSLSVSLFVATFFSALLAQVRPLPREESFTALLRGVLAEPARLLEGLPFAVALMGILLAHEMGHYLVARRRGIVQSPPFFVPAPTVFGTFGAVIFMRSRPPTRGALLDVAVAGPLVGLVVAVPLAAWGLVHSQPIDPGDLEAGGLWFGSSLLFHFLEGIFSPNGTDVILHPVGLAGWVGLFVTSLNLIPAAQLDGGHIAYAILGRHHRRLSRLIVAALLLVGLWEGIDGGGLVWIFWALLLFIVGPGHPPVADESVHPSPRQRALGLLALLVFGITFVPSPVMVVGPGRPREEAIEAPPAPEETIPWPDESYDL